MSYQSGYIKITLLSISALVVVSGASVSPALQAIRSGFPEVSELLVQQILTLPALTIIFASCFSMYLMRIWNRRSVILLGIFLYFLGGILGGAASNIFCLLFSRIIVGSGVGIMLPASTSLIADSFQGKEQKRMWGFNAGAGSFGGVVANVSGGLLAALSWRHVFLLYLLSLPVGFLAYRYLPRDLYCQDKQDQEKPFKYKKKVFFWMSQIFLLMIAFYVIPTNMAFYVAEMGLGGPATNGYFLGTFGISGLIAGLIFAKLVSGRDSLIKWTGLFLLSAGFLALGSTNVVWLVLLGIVGIGFSCGILNAYLYMRVSSTVDTLVSGIAMSGMSMALYFGQFSSPFFMHGFSHFFQFETLSKMFFGFGLSVIGYAVFVFGGAVIVKKKKRPDHF